MLARKFAPALRDLFPHLLFGVLLRAYGALVGQSRTREKPFPGNRASRLHAISLARRPAHRLARLHFMVTEEPQIRGIYRRLAVGPAYAVTTERSLSAA